MSDRRFELVVVGAHLSGMALNHELQQRGGVLSRAVSTKPLYRLYSLVGGPPFRPGLLRVGEGGGAIATEVWTLPGEGFADFVCTIPAPLCIGTLELADDTRPKGFLVEPTGLEGAQDITAHGGWRAYMAAREGVAPDA